MPRGKKKQVRIGQQEQRLLSDLVKTIKDYKIFSGNKKERETKFNERLRDYLLQRDFDVVNKKIYMTEIMGERFRPEFYVRSDSGKKLCAVECKRLTENNAKSRWKEGISQAILYSLTYKAVILLYFDFTKGAKYVAKIGSGRTLENRFLGILKKKHHIHVVLLTPRN